MTNGGVVSNTRSVIGGGSGSTGSVTVDGSASQLNNSGDLSVGFSGTGTLNVTNGGVVSSASGFIGRNSGSTGSVTVDGSGSQWNSSTNLYLGTNDGTTDGGVGSLDITDSGRVIVGNDPAAFSGTPFTISSNVSGQGNLVVRNGSTVTSNSGTAFIGESNGYTGTATVDGSGSRWNNSGSLFVGVSGTGTLNVTNGGVVSNTVGLIGAASISTGSVTVDGSGSQWNNSFDLSVGNSGTGTLNVTNGGVVSNAGGIIGDDSGSTGIVTVDGSGSQWNNSGILFVGNSGTGTLNVTNGGVVSSTAGAIGFNSAANGTATVDGSGSQWNNSSDLSVGTFGTGTLNVTNGGVVSNRTGLIGINSGSTGGSVTVDGSGSQWNNSFSLFVGSFGTSTGTVNVTNGGLVSVGGTTNIRTTGTVTVGGGRFEFGETDLTSFGRIGGTSGSLAGNVNISGIHNVANLTVFQNSNFDISEVNTANTGILFGSAFLATALNNQSTGELRTLSSDFVRFEGVGSTNAGQINNYGGVTEFTNDLTNLSGGEIDASGVIRVGELSNLSGGTIILTNGSLIADQMIFNEAGGFINGRGVIEAADGFSNYGNIALSGGTTDFRGEVLNSVDGLIVTSGNATTTFFDGLEHQGEIRTQTGSSVVIFEDYSGAGNFTGTGDVFIEGSVNPGNSPAAISFGGNLFLGSESLIHFEIADDSFGDFDSLLIAGDLTIDGELSVSLLDEFTLSANQQFLIADVLGSTFGEFTSFGEGDVVGNFGGRDLFVTYQAGNGNDIALFTAVPEPGSFLVLTGLLALAAGRRRRKA